MQRTRNLHSARRLTASALVVCLALFAAACSSTGGKPRPTAPGAGTNQANTPRMTIAMVHPLPHPAEVPLGEPAARAPGEADSRGLWEVSVCQLSGFSRG